MRTASEKTISNDFLAALENRPKAMNVFAASNKANLYAIGYRLATAKKPETGQWRFDKFLNMMENG